MKNKKGISDVVTTVLIILLVVAAVAIIWSFVSRPLQQSGQALETSTNCLQISLAPTACSINSSDSAGKATATYKWNSGSATISGVKVVFELKDGTNDVVTGTAPAGVGSTQRAISTKSNATAVSVAAVITGSDGKDATCSASLEKVACS